MTTRKKRRNSDNEIRRLERIYASEGTESSMVRLWRAQLRAGIMPIPSSINHGVPEWYQYWVIHTKGKELKNAVLFYDIRTKDASITKSNNTHINIGKVEPEELRKWLSLLIEEHEDKMYNPRHIRRNSDDLLRKLERQAATSKSLDDTMAYWQACLRAGQLPTPTSSYTTKYKVTWDTWTLPQVSYLKRPEVMATKDWTSISANIPTKDSHDYVIRLYTYQGGLKRGPITFETDSVKQALEFIIKDYEAGKFLTKRRKKNPDDDIRRLERIWLADPSEENTAKYWRACLRAGELPRASQSKDPKEQDSSDGSYEMWYLHPYKSGMNLRKFQQRRVVLNFMTALDGTNWYRISYPLGPDVQDGEEGYWEQPETSYQPTPELAYEHVKRWLTYILDQHGY